MPRSGQYTHQFQEHFYSFVVYKVLYSILFNFGFWEVMAMVEDNATDVFGILIQFLAAEMCFKQNKIRSVRINVELISVKI